MKRTSKIRIGEGKPQSALAYLSERFTYHDFARWTQEINAGRIVINGELATCETVFHQGDEIEYFPEARPEPDIDDRVTVVHEDDSFLALCKSGNLPCHPAGIFFNHTLWAMLREGRIDGIAPREEIHFISRLDRETSGIVLIAKDGRAAKRATRALRSERACKEYLTVVEGEFPDMLEANGWLWSDPTSLIKKKRRFGETVPEGISNAETSLTTFRCLRRGNGMSLLQATLGTGRTHQIRATLCSLGYPVVGDKLYGVDETMYLRFVSGTMSDNDRHKLRIGRQALHAWHLRLPLEQNKDLDLRTAEPDFTSLVLDGSTNKGDI